MEFKVVAGILTKSELDLQSKLKQAGELSMGVSVDVIDEKFGGDVTVSVERLVELEKEMATVEVQLMVEEPVGYLEKLSEWGAWRVVGQVEMMSDVQGFIDRSRERGISVGLGLDLPTQIDTLDEKTLKQVDAVLLMAVKAGKSGQVFDEKVLGKVKELRRRGYEGDIMLDGGINKETLVQGKQAGANQFSATSFIWGDGEPGLRYRQLVDLL